MKVQWCWRCKEDVPMLDENEYTVIDNLYIECLEQVKDYRKRHKTSLADTPIDELYEPLKHEYDRITGMHTNYHQDEIRKHRLARYGPPCHMCGKPLRTPEAKRCVACGAVRELSNQMA